jgi:hypothetical protein
MSRKANKSVGARYECIYKNFLREIRQYYSTKFESYLKNQPPIRKNNLQKKCLLFPYQMLQFTSEIFNHELTQAMMEGDPKDIVNLSQNMK